MLSRDTKQLINRTSITLRRKEEITMLSRNTKQLINRMSITLRIASVSLLGILVATLFSLNANAAEEKYPNRAIEVIVTYSAGGGTDIRIRTLAPFLEKELGVPIVIINKGEAGGVVGWTAIAKAKPDGYTIGTINLPGIVGTYVTDRLKFDPRTSFKLLGNIAIDHNSIAVRSDSKLNNMTDLVKYLKQNPEGLSYGVTGTVSFDALTALSVEKSGDVKFRIVNFKGGKDAITALLGGHIDMVGLSVSEGYEYVKGGELKLLGIGGDERYPELPNTPTFKEQGIDMYVTSSTQGLQITAGADDKIVSRLREAVRKVASSKEFEERCRKAGFRGFYIDYHLAEETLQKQIDWMSKVLPKQ